MPTKLVTATKQKVAMTLSFYEYYYLPMTMEKKAFLHGLNVTTYVMVIHIIRETAATSMA